MTSSDVRTTGPTPEDQPDPVEKVVVVGIGAIGLPLAIKLAECGKTVVGVDIDEERVASINEGTLQVDEAEFRSLLESEPVRQNLEAQTTPTEGDAFVISVPTPLVDPNKSPDLAAFEAAIDSILPYLSEGDLVNVESTIPPLTCDDVVVPRLEAAGFRPGVDIQLAHSPERILPGNVFEELVHNDRIIGGIDEESAKRAAKVYEPFLEGDVYRTDLLAAELCKLMENTYRDVNIALANEFSIIGDNLEIDIRRVITLANRHPRVDILRPGIGVGGHCLPVDPWFLNEVDPEHTNLITTARRINDKMPHLRAREIRHLLSEYDSPTVLALGAAYKPNTYDCRNSPAVEIVDELRLDGYHIEHYDRHVDGMAYRNLTTLLEKHDPDVVVQLVPHDDTVTQLEHHRSRLAENGIDLVQFGNDTPDQQHKQ